jgi:Citrate synthase, C-terminal domain
MRQPPLRVIFPFLCGLGSRQPTRRWHRMTGGMGNHSLRQARSKSGNTRVQQNLSPSLLLRRTMSNDELAYRSVSEYRSVAIALVNVTADHEFFRDRRIFPNPDLFNGIFFKWIGVPPKMNAVMLSMSRIVGWIAHYIEQRRDGLPIMRPRQLQQRA